MSKTPPIYRANKIVGTNGIVIVAINKIECTTTTTDRIEITDRNTDRVECKYRKIKKR